MSCSPMAGRCLYDRKLYAARIGYESTITRGIQNAGEILNDLADRGTQNDDIGSGNGLEEMR